MTTTNHILDLIVRKQNLQLEKREELEEAIRQINTNIDRLKKDGDTLQEEIRLLWVAFDMQQVRSLSDSEKSSTKQDTGGARDHVREDIQL